MFKPRLHWQILIALLLAALAGTEGEWLGVRFYAVFDFIGTLFLNALMLLIAPLVVSSIIVGIAAELAVHCWIQRNYFASDSRYALG